MNINGIEITTIQDLEKTDIFYLNPIIGWAIHESSNKMLFCTPIIPEPWINDILDEVHRDEDYNLIKILPAKNDSFYIKVMGDEKFKCLQDKFDNIFYVNGLFSSFDRSWTFVGFIEEVNKCIKKIKE